MKDSSNLFDFTYRKKKEKVANQFSKILSLILGFLISRSVNKKGNICN